MAYETPTLTGKNYEDDGTKMPMSAGIAAKAGMLAALTAQNTYNKSNQVLNNSYNQRKNALTDNYNSALNSLKSNYDTSAKEVSDTASNNLQQAYINNMLSQKNLKQKMASQGLNGGATESTLARLINAYGNNRNSINNQKSKDLTSLLNNYNTNRSSALQTYNNALAQLSQDRYNQQAQILDNYNNAMQQAMYNYASSGAADDNQFEDWTRRLTGTYMYPNLSGSNLANSYMNYLAGGL